MSTGGLSYVRSATSASLPTVILFVSHPLPSAHPDRSVDSCPSVSQSAGVGAGEV